MSDKTIYALMVGIDRYQPPVPALDGCVNDMHAMRDHLYRRSRRDGVKLEMVVLENEDATRFNIVSQFENHLCQAGPEDIAFFYYSGHGSQEPAHEVFWHIEEDRKNETLVCYDSRMGDGMDLADKEVATLLDMVAQKNPHIVVVLDCCNSGGATRFAASKDLETDEEPVFKARQSPASKAVRTLDSYILPRNFSADRAVSASNEAQNLIIPESRHVTLAAAHSFQLAKETYLGGSPRGVFTYSLVEVLETATGALTYNDLMRRVRTLVTQRTYDQNPQITFLEAGDIDKVFLDGLTTRESNFFNLMHDDQKGWIIDAGQVHGIMGPGYSGETTQLAVFAEDSSADEQKDLSRALGRVSVTNASPSQSTVRIEGSLWLDENTTYRARVYSSPIEPIRVCIRGDSQQGIDLARQALSNNAQAAVYLKEVSDRYQADYNLICNGQKSLYYVTRSTDEDFQPVAEQIIGFNPDTARKAIEQLQHIARWQKLLELNNPGSAIPTEGVRIEILHPTEDRPFYPSPEGLVFPYRESDGPQGIPRFRVKLVNTSGMRLYCALLYMSSSYEANPGLLQHGGLWLDPGAEAWAISGKPFGGKVADEWIAFGKTEVTETFKLICSTVDFDATLMRMVKLGLPNPALRSTKKEHNTRSLLFSDMSSNPAEDWNTNEVSITLRRLDPPPRI